MKIVESATTTLEIKDAILFLLEARPKWIEMAFDQAQAIDNILTTLNVIKEKIGYEKHD